MSCQLTVVKYRKQKSAHLWMSVYRFQRKGSRQILKLSLMGETTVKEGIVKAKDLGFLPECDLENVSVVHGSRLVGLSERVSDICVDSGDNLFVVDVECCERDCVRALCDMGFSRSNAIEALSESGGELDQAISLLLNDIVQIGSEEAIRCSLNSQGPDETFSDVADEEEASDFRRLNFFADNGDVEAQMKCGYCLLDGDGVDQDKEEAARYFKMAADQGDCDGQFAYGICLLDGDGVDQDKGEAAHYFKMSADQGDCDGQFAYGICLLDGDGVDQDKAEAARYFKMSADQGNCDGQLRYGMCLLDGDGIDKDKGEAARYFKMAADQGNCDGQFFYGICLRDGDGVDQDKAEAARYFKMAADQGNCGGQFFYGMRLLRGDGVDQDKAEAARYLKMSADQGDCDGQFFYGMRLARGEGVDQDKAEAARYFKMAADQGDCGGQVNYGACLFNGYGVDQDRREAARYFKMAAGQGDYMGQFNYGACLFNGGGGSEDKQEAVRYFQMAAGQGYPDGELYYGLCLFRRIGGLRRNDSEAGRYVMLAAKSGLPMAQALYGLFLYHGKCVDWNPEEGIRYFEMSAKNGDELGRYCYAVHLLEECSGRIKENRQIVDDFQKLSKKNGDATNLFALCIAVFLGSFDHENFAMILKHSIKQECFCAKFNYASYLLHFFSDDDTYISEAIDLFKSVSHQGQDDSDYYRYDSFLKRDLGLDSPSRWRFIKAEADAGHCEAQFIYGKHLYSLGSHDEARQYFEKSAKNKHSEAMFAYAALSIHEFGGKWRDFERYFKRAASDGVLLAQYNYGVHLAGDSSPNVRVDGAKFLQMSAREILLRREAKIVKIGDGHSYPSFMYSPIPDQFVLKATDNYLIEHLSKNFCRLDRMTWAEIRSPKTLTIH